MYSFLYNLHHYWSYLALVMLFTFLIISVAFFFQKKEINPGVKKISFFLVLTLHIQLILGLVMLVVYLTSPHDPIMKDAPLRMRYVEHPTAMIISVVLMTIVNIKVKKTDKFNWWMVLLTVLSVIFILYMIPSSFYKF